MTTLPVATWASPALDEEGVRRLGEIIAFLLRRGDQVLLSGPLGAGKTTLARAIVRAVLADADAEVASPTFALVQTYAGGRLTLAHADLYRLSDPQETAELGLEEALGAGAILVEWPERGVLPAAAARLEITIGETEEPGRRHLRCTGHASWAARLARVGPIQSFLDAHGWRTGHVGFLQGDASPRRYARLGDGRRRAVLMDAPRQPDGPPVRAGLPYSRIAHLAEDVRPFVAVAGALGSAGLSVPEILAADLDAGLLLLEDLGDMTFGRAIAAGAPQAELWRAAVEVLLALRRAAPATRIATSAGDAYTLPRFDRAALEIEVELILDWYWPAVKGAPAPDALRREFQALWAPLLDRMLAEPAGWFIRDYHSPNLFWLPERAGVRRVGIIDFQDALAEPWAYDLASLLQDARLDVPEALERTLLDHYCAEVAACEASFDRARFLASYALFGAQRNTRLVGLWARLLRRDLKPHYLRHMPRTWRYLARNLAHPALAGIADWYGRHFPPEIRDRPLDR
jgi:hypothetical protein